MAHDPVPSSSGVTDSNPVRGSIGKLTCLSVLCCFAQSVRAHCCGITYELEGQKNEKSEIKSKQRG